MSVVEKSSWNGSAWGCRHLAAGEAFIGVDLFEERKESCNRWLKEKKHLQAHCTCTGTVRVCVLGVTAL
jgi:hypothetical protein